jgi:hypothetical protein
VAGNRWVLTLEHTLEKPVHVIGAEGRDQSTHLVSYAAERPDIRLKVIGLILPDLRTGVVGGTSLGVEEAFLGHLRDIQITQLGCLVLVKEDVSTLHVSM